MLKIIAIAFAVLVAAFLIFAATQPDTFRVERKILIKAAPEKIHAEISNFYRWNGWSPWENKDPNMKRNFSGASNGIGAIYGWEGDQNVGTGRMEITASTLDKIIIKLDFLKPFEAHNTAEFTLTPQGDSTEVSWAMYGPSPYFSKIIQIFCNMDKMVGGDFETGLGNLKKIAEK